VRRALPRWDAAFPGDRRPHALVDLVAEALAGRRAEADVHAAANELRRALEHIGAGDPDPGFFAGHAAVAHSYEAYDGDLDEEIDPFDTEDTELDQPRVEVFAAYAFGVADHDAHRAFWRWYVTEAFPAAYRAAE
jgi:Immunity protein Imm5